MNIKRIGILLVFGIIALTLASCTGAGMSNSFTGALVTDQYVFFASGAKVYALDAASGDSEWSYPKKATATRLFYAEPVLAGEQLIVVDYEKMLTSLDPTDGTENWQFIDAKGKYIDSPLVTDDLIIAPNGDYSLYALDYEGNLVWTFEAEQALWTRPVTDGTTVYFPSMDRNLYALDITNGELKWKTDLGTSTVARPTLDNGVIYIGNLNGNVFAINAEDGSVLWEKIVEGGVWAAPILYEGTLYFGDLTGRINLINATDGDVVDTVDIKDASTDEEKAAILGAGALLSDGIVFGNEEGKLVKIDFTGKEIDDETLDGPIYSNIQFMGEQLIVCVSQSKAKILLISLDTDFRDNWDFVESKEDK
jgi:outer membrane protein assembly factor BamB